MFFNAIAFKPAPGVKAGRGGVTFNPDLPGPCTVSTSTPFSAPGIRGFEVHMPTKQARTAVGLAAEPLIEYMTPSYTRRRDYVSMGGAGDATVHWLV